MTDPIRTRVEVPHNDAPGEHEWFFSLVIARRDSDEPYLQWECEVPECPGRLLVREADIEQLVNNAVKETT